MFLGLDLASRSTGWCAGAGDRVPECGAWQLEPARNDDGSYEYGRNLASLQDYMDVAFARFRPQAVSYEAPILITRRRQRPGQSVLEPGQLQEREFSDTLRKLRLLYPLGAFVEWYCYRAGVPCYEVTVAEIKTEVTGNRHAQKGDLIAIAQKCGLTLPAASAGADDAADAFGAWLLLLRAFNKNLSAQWDRRVYSPRGLLL